jgi:hypothetical protein
MHRTSVELDGKPAKEGIGLFNKRTTKDLVRLLCHEEFQSINQLFKGRTFRFGWDAHFVFNGLNKN